MEKKALYQIEIQRSNVTPREFWTYCKREFLRRTGGELALESWQEFDEGDVLRLETGLLLPRERFL